MYKELIPTNIEWDTYGANDKIKIAQIKKYMGAEIPKSFRIFLEELGAGGSAECQEVFDIIGTGQHPSGIASFVLANKREREKNIPDNYFLVMDTGNVVRWYLALDPKKDDSPIVGFIIGVPPEEQSQWVKDNEYFDNFLEFFKVKVIGL